MSETIRTFIAVRIPASAALRNVLRDLTQLGRAVKSVAPDKLHVTLKFLGDIEAAGIDQIAQRIHAAVHTEPTFRPKVTGLGAFPHPRRPSVIWAGLLEAQPLVSIAKHLESSLQEIGYPAERRPFQPHLTLARVKRRPPVELRILLDRHQQTEFGEVELTEVELFQSELCPEGPRYTSLVSFPLSAAATR